MALISFGGKGGKSESDFDKSGTRTITESTSRKSEREQQQERAGTQETRTTGRILDVDTENILKSMISSLATSGEEDRDLASAGIQAQQESIDFAQVLADRALGTQEFVDERIGAIVNEARRRGTEELVRQRTNLGNAAGSDLNSFVQIAQAEGRADLESQLAALEAEMALQGRELESRDVIAAADALQTAGVQAQVPGTTRSGAVSDVASLAGILRGATTESVSIGETEETAALTETALQEQLRELFERFQETGKVDSSGFELGGGFGF